MARTFLRSGGAVQVTPDTLVWRRNEAPYSWDTPVDQATELHPLMGRKGRPGIFDLVDLQLEFVATNARMSVPRIRYGRDLFTVNRAGDATPSVARQGTSLLTLTGKMSCPSFSLPAGPTTEHGSCAAANTGRRGGKRELGRIFICDGCYALESQYVYPNVSTAQAARQSWVIQQLRHDPTGAELGRQMVAAINDFAHHATFRGMRNGGMAKRITQELGVWGDNHIQVPVYLPDLNQVRYVQGISTPLPPEAGWPDTTAFFRSRQPPEGAVTGFFRIHDSGGFTPGSTSGLWKGYLNAWIYIARSLPHVLFWAPARIWVFPSLRKHLVEHGAGLTNLVIRPSALHVNDAAPSLQGFANGTTVSELVGRGKTKAFTPTTDEQGQPTYDCPVYLKNTAPSCMAAGCRACWIAPRLPVAYAWH